MRVELSPDSQCIRVYPKDDARAGIDMHPYNAGRAIFEILLAQKMNHGRAQIGTPSFPTQAQHNKFIENKIADKFAALDLEIDL